MLVSLMCIDIQEVDNLTLKTFTKFMMIAFLSIAQHNYQSVS